MTKNPSVRLDRLAERLFREFARMEYALKAANFHNREGDAQPDWRAFALSLNNGLTDSQDEEVRNAVRYLLAHPPRKQVIREGLLQWDDAPVQTDSETDRILLYVRRVRNNLFHGGKFNGHWFAPERSEELLRCCLVILDACRAASNDVEVAYRSS